MTYFLKDCDRKVSPPAKGREDIARAIADTFATRPYIRFAVFIEPYADGSGDDSVELIAVPRQEVWRAAGPVGSHGVRGIRLRLGRGPRQGRRLLLG